MRIITFLLISLIMTSLFPASYESNELGMRLSCKDALDGTGYELSVEDDVEILFKDGCEIRRVERNDDGYVIIDENDSRISITLDDEKRIIREESQEGVRRNNYNDDGLLISSVLSAGDEIISYDSYFYDSSGNLIRLDSLDFSYVFSDHSFYFGSGDDVSFVPEGMSSAVSSSAADGITRMEDGSIVSHESDGKVRTYSPSGLLMREEHGDEVRSFSYSEDGSLSSESIARGHETEIRHYENSALKKIEYYDEKELKRVRSYGDGSIEEKRFRDGKPYAIISYDMDGRTVRDVKIL